MQASAAHSIMDRCLCSNEGRIHLRRPTCYLIFRLRQSGGPYIPVRRQPCPESSIRDVPMNIREIRMPHQRVAVTMVKSHKFFVVSRVTPPIDLPLIRTYHSVSDHALPTRGADRFPLPPHPQD